MKIKQLIKMTGAVTESYDDEDDLSPAERALIAKAEKDLAKKGIKVKDFDPDKMVGKNKEDKEESGDEQQSVVKAKPTAKSAEKPSEQKEKDGKEETPTRARGDKAVAARKFLQDNPSASRKQFTEFMSKHGVSSAYANTMFYAMKKKLHEVFYITNEKGEVLAEGDVWTVFEDYDKRLLVFQNEWRACSKALKVEGKTERFGIEMLDEKIVSNRFHQEPPVDPEERKALAKDIKTNRARARDTYSKSTKNPRS